jgi:hypothetical protein
VVEQNDPAVHEVHEAPAPPVEKVPTGQRLVGDVSPAVAQYEPAVQLTAPVVVEGQYEPMEHVVQAAPPPREYEPAVHAVHGPTPLPE